MTEIFVYFCYNDMLTMAPHNTSEFTHLSFINGHSFTSSE